MSGTSKVFIYGIALAAATGVYAGLSALFGAGLSGFPAFSVVEVGRIDYVLMIIYIICGCILAVFYEKTHQLMQTATKRIPAVLRETLAGLILGVCGTLIPAVMFSGEEQMGILMKEYMNYLPLALIGVAFLKILLTNLCIQSGLKGGHFFPIIFAEYAWDMYCNAALRKCRESYGVCDSNCYGSIARRNDENHCSYDALFCVIRSNGLSGYSWRQPRAVRSINLEGKRIKAELIEKAVIQM